MTRSEIVISVSNMVERLRKPLAADEVAIGWTDLKRLDMLRYFESLDAQLKAGVEIPFFSLVRTLDGMGISEGGLLDEMCSINNAVNRLGK